MGSSATLFTVYPNPSTQDITLSIASDKKQKGMYNVYDQAGKKMVANMVSLDKGINTISFSTSNLPAGIYYIQLVSETLVKQAQFIKQ
jgi:hypothetical protein